jgi:hypothetical protein
MDAPHFFHTAKLRLEKVVFVEFDWKRPVDGQHPAERAGVAPLQRTAPEVMVLVRGAL